MKKRVLAMFLALVMLLAILSGCGSNDNSNDSNNSSQENSGGSSNVTGGNDTQDTESQGLTELRSASVTTADLATLSILNTSSPNTFKNLSNLYDPMVSMDNKGNIVPCLAESWEESDNGLTWTFHIRDNATWVDYQGNVKADVVAEDFLWGLEFTMNYYKGGSTNISGPGPIIVGANDYYTYTSNMEEVDAVV